jgi:site-specific recombinase XerD
VSTRNNRLATIHSLFAYLALHHPEHAASIARVLVIPPKRSEHNLLTYLTDTEVDTLLATIDQSTWTGRRDHAMSALTIQTGLRISELTGLTRGDVTFGVGANVHTVGKGRKERRTPLISTTTAILTAWLQRNRATRSTHTFPPEPVDRLVHPASDAQTKKIPEGRHQRRRVSRGAPPSPEW